MLADGQTMIHFFSDHYEEEIAQHLYPFWYRYYHYLSQHYAQMDRYIIQTHQWMQQVITLSNTCSNRFFFYSKLPALNNEEKEAFLASIHQRLEDSVALGVCLPHRISQDQQVLGLWENTIGDHMRLHVRKHDIQFGFVLVDDELFFERPAQADDTKRHIYHVTGIQEETISHLLNNPHLQTPKVLQNYFLR
ncbi:hypothetical protein [Entomospira culicis]|uniref:Uncharacterized protein n=1 Tax=Entomospira culicis TaxID=2719989 RepID=A0A968GIN8_9SPIO|nr:hypothetical protein [Entomospira culicis]NIZ19421.1 hypothetical protein [Entomospira culicis]NIZ69674.1 hypothetical protein [Entomospira culicis]WDI36784.1 hypothetical protein PVA46_05520 [Entomospira culicis]WDI38413.1 hypothetical protein PVA47_05530 [Entomospira culicis]